MKSITEKISRFIHRFFQNRGYFIRINQFDSVEDVYEYIKYLPENIRFFELQEITKRIAKARNHRFYEKLLRSDINQWNIKIKKAKFVGEGRGKSALNTYRKIVIGEKILFEKVYKTSSNGLKKNIWFQKEIYPLLRVDLKIPKIQKQFQGEHFTILYYDFIETDHFSIQKTTEQAIEIAKYFYEKTTMWKESFHQTFPKYVTDYKNLNRYVTKIELVKRELAGKNIKFSTVENRVDNSRKVLTHLDLKRENIFDNGFLIDWDEAGFYPIGMEQANIYFRNILYYDREENTPLFWLEENFKTAIPRKEWADYELNFVFFLYIFGFKYLHKKKYRELNNKLITEIRKRL